ncbi:MAG TPA: hypothetical protein VIL20_29245 [Sandaracinaceae bacterium]
MRWIVAAALLVLASAAAAQDEPVLGVDTGGTSGAPPDRREVEPSGTGGDARAVAPASDGAEGTGAAPGPRSDEASDASAPGADSGGEGETNDPGADEEGAAESDGEASTEAPPSRARWTDERTGAWAGFAASFGVAILGGVLLAVGIDDYNTIENAPGGTSWADVAGAYERAPILTGTGAAVLGLGVVATAVSAALLAHFGGEGTWLEVSVLPGGALARGRF